MKNKTDSLEKLEQHNQVFKNLDNLASKFNMEVAKDFSKKQDGVKTLNPSGSQTTLSHQSSHNVQDKLKKLQNSQHMTKLDEEEQNFFNNMAGFVDSYYDIYNFSREKIEQDLHVVLDYYLNELDKFNVQNIDLLDQAKSFVERKQKRDSFLKSLDSEHKRIVDEILENHRKHRKNILAKSEDVMSDTEKRIRELIEKFKIYINRSEMGKEAIKGYNKCKDNDQAFIEHKKGALFPRKYIDPHLIIMERKEHIEDLEKEIKKIEEQESYRNDIYQYAYKAHISPRMITVSPNTSQSQLSKAILQRRGADESMSDAMNSQPAGGITTDRSLPGANFKLRLINQSSAMGLQDFGHRNAARKQAATMMHSPRGLGPDSEYGGEVDRASELQGIIGSKKKGKLQPFKGLSLPSMIDQTSDGNITEPTKQVDQENRFKLPSLKLPLNINKASAMLSPTGTSQLSIDQYLNTREDEDKLPIPARKRGNASTLRPSAYLGGLDSLLNITETLNPKVSYSDLRKLYKPTSHLSKDKKLISNTSSINQKMSFLSPTPSLKSLRAHIGNFNTVKKEQNQEKHRSQVTKGRVRNLIHACFYLENEDRQQNKGGGVRDVERDLFIEQLRQEKIRDTVDLLREIEYSENPHKLKQIYMYKVITADDYVQESRILKNEYKNGLMDPKRTVARLEMKRGRTNKK